MGLKRSTVVWNLVWNVAAGSRRRIEEEPQGFDRSAESTSPRICEAYLHKVRRETDGFLKHRRRVVVKEGRKENSNFRDFLIDRSTAEHSLHGNSMSSVSMKHLPTVENIPPVYKNTLIH